jgi:hypothetical protein
MHKEMNPIERHLQTVLQAVAVAMLLWAGTSIQDAREKIARMEERISEFRVQLTAASDGRYRTNDAARDFAITAAQMNALERRIETLERSRAR